MHRRLMSVVAAIVACGAGGVADMRQTAPPLTITFDGGNAFIRTGQGRGPLVVGAITPAHPPHHYNMHRMRLGLSKGAADKTSTYRPLDLPEVGQHWDLTGYVVKICPGGQCPASGEVEIEPSSLNRLSCDSATEDSGLIPDLTAMHDNALAVADWRERLDSELVLYGGKLTARATECFQFKRGATTLERRIAGRQQEITWTAARATFIDIIFARRQGGAERRARVRDNGQGISLRVWTLASDNTYKNPGVEPIKHFQQFYDLLDIGPKDRYELHWKPAGAPELRTPGTECPPAMLTAS